MDEKKKCENICVCFKCLAAVDSGGTCTNCEECISREKAKQVCVRSKWPEEHAE